MEGLGAFHEEGWEDVGVLRLTPEQRHKAPSHSVCGQQGKAALVEKEQLRGRVGCVPVQDAGLQPQVHALLPTPCSRHL